MFILSGGWDVTPPRVALSVLLSPLRLVFLRADVFNSPDLGVSNDERCRFQATCELTAFFLSEKPKHRSGEQKIAVGVGK